MKMKVIDLLNMHARNEEMPKQIKIGEGAEIFTYDGYMYKDDGMYITDLLDFFNCLNKEVEIIEEDKKIEKISYDDHIGIDLSEAVCNKLNEVIDALNKMKVDD